VRVDDLATAKKAVRAERLAWRSTLSAGQLAEGAEAFAEAALEQAQRRQASVVTMYASVDNEPGTRPALERLHAAGVRVLLPVLIVPGLDLDWAEYVPGELREARRGLQEPTGERLGREAIALADIIFCPGLAGTRRGRRLGQGGACYDKALPRARVDTPRLLMIYDEDVLQDVPTDERDQLVDALLTPSGLTETGARVA
jgi:5-formyltetrahydrofolate cyclo-ligase